MLRGVVIGVVAVIVVVGGVLFAQRLEPAVRQPIQFNHAKHIAQGLECAACHQYVKEQTFAGLPTVETCMMCHSAPQTKSPEEEKVRQFAEKGQGIPWQRLYRMPGHVFFSHRRHVSVAKVECQTCHGAMAQATTPPSRPLVNQSMSWCLACHEKRQASVDCVACHK
ncbi:MAG: cytochrome c3 family protein [Deltaproteobacteria bacterium]|nr:cytochrome c3 family protein [Deltaproteobacteria bacterium]